MTNKIKKKEFEHKNLLLIDRDVHSFFLRNIVDSKTTTHSAVLTFIHFLFKLCDYWKLNPEIRDQFWREAIEATDRESLEKDIRENMTFDILMNYKLPVKKGEKMPTGLQKEPAEKHRGFVKWFCTKKNYGFITFSDKSEDIFVHWSAILGDEKYKVLRQGDLVEFEVGRGSDGRAKAISVIILPQQTTI